MSERTLLALYRQHKLPAGKDAGKWMLSPGTVPRVHLIKPSTLAEALGVSERYVRMLCVNGKLSEAFKVGGGWRIPITAAADLMNCRLELPRGETDA